MTEIWTTTAHLFLEVVACVCRGAMECQAGFLLSPSTPQYFPLATENQISIPFLFDALVIPTKLQ